MYYSFPLLLEKLAGVAQWSSLQRKKGGGRERETVHESKKKKNTTKKSTLRKNNRKGEIEGERKNEE